MDRLQALGRELEQKWRETSLPPWTQKVGMGFMMGASAGMTVGFLHGTFTALRYGPTPGKTYLSTIGSFMVSHGSMLGFFLA